MRTNGHTPNVIFSLNSVAASYLLERFPHLHIKEGRGCFNGEREPAFSIPLSEFTPEVREFLHGDGQQFVLLLDNQCNAFLSAGPDFPSYATGQAKYIGEFREVEQITAERSPSWTEFAGQYYVAR